MNAPGQAGQTGMGCPAGAGETKVIMVKFQPYAHLPGGFSQNDGTIDFYGRINSLLRGDMRVLDLGAGRAAWFEDDPSAYRRSLRLLKGKVAEVIATDVDEAVQQNRSCDRALLMEDGIIPLEDNSVDMVIADYVLEHVDDADGFRAEVSRVLRPGGYFCARTPHKWSYVSVLARLLGNAHHIPILSRAQPDRKAVDVFPTRYRLNTLHTVRSCFAGFEDFSLIYRPDPAYYFGNRSLYHALGFLHRLMPAALSGGLFVFLQKPGRAPGRPEHKASC